MTDPTGRVMPIYRVSLGNMPILMFRTPLTNSVAVPRSSRGRALGVHVSDRVVLVGDRGMLTEAQLRNRRAYQGLGWIPALRSPAIRELVTSGTLQLSRFDLIASPLVRRKWALQRSECMISST